MTVIPAKFGTETVTYKKTEYPSKLSVVQAQFDKSSQSVETRAASAMWTMTDREPNCESADPNDCRYWCYKAVPAQFTTIATSVLAKDAYVTRTPGCNQDGGTDPNCGNGTYTKKVVIEPAKTVVNTVPAVYETVKQKVMVTPPTTREIEVPAVTKTVTKKVMVTPPTTKVVDVPAVTEVVKRTVMVAPPTTRVIEIPAVTKTMKRTVVATPASTQVVDIPGKTESFKVTNISNEAVRETEIPAVTKTMTKTVMVTPPTAQEVEVAAKTATISKTFVEKDTYVEEEMVPGTKKTVSKEVLVKKGGLTSWKEVACNLVNNYSPLPIQWNVNSAELTPQAKSLIDTRLLPVLKDGVAVEIASHTDSRGTAESNADLSERRAQSVANYLISKGVHPSKLVSKGYGESRLLNRCADGVSCTEAEHQVNRRTEFRVINQ